MQPLVTSIFLDHFVAGGTKGGGGGFFAGSALFGSFSGRSGGGGAFGAFGGLMVLSKTCGGGILVLTAGV